MAKKQRVVRKVNTDRKDPKVAYLCDGMGCGEQCINMTHDQWAHYPCHHTFDESHARNKIRRERKFRCDRDPKTGAVVGYTEIER